MSAGRRVAVPLYEKIRRAVAGPIHAGRLVPGERIPSESELMARFGCSRMTVSKALSALADEGLIVRRRKAGSFVAQPAARHELGVIIDPRHEVEEMGRRYRFELLERRVGRARAEIAERLEVDSGTRVLRLLCRHHAGAEPFGLEERAISLAAVPEAEDEGFTDTPPSRWLLDRVPWTEGEHLIRAAAADRRAAALLDVEPGAPCLVVERRTWLAGEPLTFVRMTHPGGRYAIESRFTPPGKEKGRHTR